MAAVLLIQNQDEADNVKQTQIVLGVTVLTLGFLSVVPGIRATEPPEVDTHANVMGESAALGESAAISLPLKTTETLSFGEVTESSAEAAEADKLAKQLANPISSLISVPFQANEDFAYGPSQNGYKFTLNIQPVIPISISKDWNLILRTIVRLSPSTISSTLKTCRRIRHYSRKTGRRTVSATRPRVSSSRPKGQDHSA